MATSEESKKIAKLLGMEMGVAIAVLVIGSIFFIIVPLLVLLYCCGYCVCILGKDAIKESQSKMAAKTSDVKIQGASKTSLSVSKDQPALCQGPKSQQEKQPSDLKIVQV